MTSKEMLDYIINSERWGEPTCVQEAVKNHEIEKWLRNQIEINEILKNKAIGYTMQINKTRLIIELDDNSVEIMKIKEWLENDN